MLITYLLANGNYKWFCLLKQYKKNIIKQDTVIIDFKVGHKNNWLSGAQSPFNINTMEKNTSIAKKKKRGGDQLLPG